MGWVLGWVAVVGVVGEVLRSNGHLGWLVWCGLDFGVVVLVVFDEN